MTVDTTMETAELSYEEETYAHATGDDAAEGPISPPSFKKNKDAISSASAWGSPPRELVRGSMVSVLFVGDPPALFVTSVALEEYLDIF